MKSIFGKLVYYLGLPIVWLAFRGSTRAYILLEYNGQVMFVKSWFGSQKWKLPGGGVKSKEPIETGALRELYEETGIKLQNKKISKILESKNKHAGASYNHIVFLANMTEIPKTYKNNFEIMELAWLEPANINLNNSDQITINALSIARFGVR